MSKEPVSYLFLREKQMPESSSSVFFSPIFFFSGSEWNFLDHPKHTAIGTSGARAHTALIAPNQL